MASLSTIYPAHKQFTEDYERISVRVDRCQELEGSLERPGDPAAPEHITIVNFFETSRCVHSNSC